jgi:uncharacterized peroxidase-related enzyme
MVPDEEASEGLARQLDKARAPNGSVDNVMRVHSLRPHTMEGHHVLYMSVLHNEGNTLPDWLLETVASYTSILNHCDYSLANHFANARHLIGDDERADRILGALRADRPENVFSGKELSFLRYARKLTVEPGDMVETDVQVLREVGASDEEILEINQVCCYFNYVNRLLNGLGVTLDGDNIGYYPGG